MREAPFLTRLFHDKPLLKAGGSLGLFAERLDLGGHLIYFTLVTFDP
jgi:hypothetical protein